MKVDFNLMYRKTNLKNVYYLSKVFDEVMNYEEYKDVILKNKKSEYKYIHYLKNLYICLSYLINSKIKEFNIIDLNILYNLLFEKNLSQEDLEEIKRLYLQEKFEFQGLKEIIKNLKGDTYNKYIYSFVIINYMVMLKYQVLYRFSKKFFRDLFNIIAISQDYDLLISILEGEIKKGLTPDENYYLNLKEITKEEIKQYLIENQERIKKEYKITHLYFFGSFAKESQRIDSDIDLLVEFNGSMRYEEKEENVIKMKKKF